MSLVQGTLIITDEHGEREYDTFTCAHCNTVVIIKPREIKGGFCQLCGKLVCDGCSNKGCTPFEKKLDLMEKRDRLLRTIGV